MTQIMKKRSITKEDGFVFASTAITVAVLLGLSILYLNNSISMNINEASDVYSSSQSYWSSLSGIEYALQMMPEEPSSVAGTYAYHGSTVTLQLSGTDYSGSALPTDQIRVISTGIHAQTTKRVLELLFQIAEQDIWPDLSIIASASSNQFDITKNFVLNDTLYIGGDVDVHDDASMGDPPGERTTLYVPTGKTVTGDFDANFTWSQTGVLSLPGFSHPEYDNMISTAQSITGTSGNKYKGNYTLTTGVLDMSGFSDRTLYIKGKFTVRGSRITGGTAASPGIIVATKDIEIRRQGSTQSVVDDNIILIGNSNIDVKDLSRIGTDYSSVPVSLRPPTVNELYAKGTIKLESNTVTWSQVYSLNRTKLEGRLYGLIRTPTGVEFDKTSSFLEGALFTQWILKPDSELDRGQMNLNHAFPMHSFSGLQYQVVAHSLREI